MSDDLKYGPNTAQVEAMLERLRGATPEELKQLRDAWAYHRVDVWEDAWEDAEAAPWHSDRNAARYAAWIAARHAAGDAAGVAAGAAIWIAIWVAIWSVQAVVVRDLLTPEQVATLLGPWRSVFGPTWEEKQ